MMGTERTGASEKRNELGKRKIRIKKTPLLRSGRLRHCHPHLQISFCLEGNGEFTVADKRFDVRAGDIVVLKSLVTHRCVPRGQYGCLFLLLEFTEDYIAPAGSSEFQYQYLKPFRQNFGEIGYKISYEEKIAEQLYFLAKELGAVYEKRDRGYNHELDAGMKMIMAKLRSYYYSRYPQDAAFENIHSVSINEALNYIKNHYLEHIKIEDIAGRVNISESRFRHVFKEMLNVSVKAYITQLRIAEAQKLLATTDYTIEHIAEKCRFGNITHFYKVFRDYVNCTPAEYRRCSQEYSEEEVEDYFKF